MIDCPTTGSDGNGLLYLLRFYYRPQTKFGARYCFYTCHSIHRGGGGGVCIQGVGGWADLQMPPHHRIGYYGIWSTNGRYAPYWNAFLLKYKSGTLVVAHSNWTCYT